LASGQPAPDLDPADLDQAINDVFATSDGTCPVDQLGTDWLDTACQHGIPVEDEDGDLLPGVDEALTHTVSAAIWFGITTGYLTLAAATTSPASSWTCWAGNKHYQTYTSSKKGILGALT
jgi:hypothetical protein